jgi:hypothetical protein
MMFAKMILASECDGCPPIYTLHLRLPRIIWPEILTHRTMSRNARSSRAVPVKRMIEEVRNEPFVPWHWGKNMPGMQAKEAMSEDEAAWCANEWRVSAKSAAFTAQLLQVAGAHKQNVNRLLEPYLWIDALVTATEWNGFFALRDHADAEPHLRDLAVMIREAIEEAEPQHLAIGEWHMPYITDAERAGMCHEHLLDLSAVRCARISYAPFNGQDDMASEQARVGKLKGEPLHASPFEHQAMADPSYSWPGRHRNFDRWAQYRAVVEAA